METIVRQKCDNLTGNYVIMSKGNRLEHNELVLAGAGLFQASGITPNPDKLKECKKIIKKREGVFSTFRGLGEYIVRTKMAISDSPEQYLTHLETVYQLLKKFSSDSRTLLAAMVIVGRDDPIYRDVAWEIREEPIHVLHLLAVHPDFRGSGLAQAMLSFLLERACDKLPREFGGLRRGLMRPVGGARRGVLRTAEVFAAKVGAGDGILTLGQWLTVPEYALAEAVNGEVFYDGYGEVTRVREALSSWPEDVRRKKLSGCLLLMAQSGQYNYARCLAHGETGAAQLAAVEFARSAMHALFLLNGAYMPYYKWQFRALRALPVLSLEAELLEYLITTGNDGDAAGEKQRVIEGVCADVIDELRRQDLTRATCGDLEQHAYSVNDGIGDGELRNLHVLAGV